MPQQIAAAVENNFTKGLITEATGLEFPENAATDTDNCSYNLIGDVTRRPGIDFETHFAQFAISRTGKAVNTYRWNNAGGDGLTQIVVVQVGTTLLFYRSSAATALSPLSTTKLSSTVDLAAFQTGSTPAPALEECQFASGNGYLFVYHPRCQPFFCSFDGTTVTATAITVNIRDFTGVLETGNPATSFRPTTLTNQHLYNLINQGWTQGSPWVATSVGSGTSVTPSGLKSFPVASGITGTTIGDQVAIINVEAQLSPSGVFIPAGSTVMAGVLSSYVGTTMVVNVNGDLLRARDTVFTTYQIIPYNKGYINTWQAGLSNYPSNADVWWSFKNTSNNFDPVATINQVTLNSGNAPKGRFIIDAFNLDRTLLSGISGLTAVNTTVRPRTGTWFQGRVWYTGVDASQAKTGDADFYTWSSNIYFSQIVTGPAQFGACHQLNDPTSETAFGLLPTDGGVITIQEAGAIYKLFPIQNGMLVFATNGVWFITGSQGIGFTANDYTITKISSIQSISGSSFVDVNGLPYFWNEEGIYAVMPQQGGGLGVNNITVDTINTFYSQIPIESKRYARGVYDPIEYRIQWIYRSASDGDNVSSRYEFDKILNFNTFNKAFFPYTVAGAFDATHPQINGVLYVTYPGSVNSPEPSVKFFCSDGGNVTFADEHDLNYVDWGATDSLDFTSYFITGYKIRGQAMRKFSNQYVRVFSQTNGEELGYTLQGIWDFSNNRNSNRWSTEQSVIRNNTRYDVIAYRHKIRGHGLALQYKISSISGLPFDILGWSSVDTVEQGT